MSRSASEPLRPVTEEESKHLHRVSRAFLQHTPPRDWLILSLRIGAVQVGKPRSTKQTFSRSEVGQGAVPISVKYDTFYWMNV